ncbi:hypothetical protein Droror1_Dr00023936 [Drosera rotundifolia]
MRYTWLLSTRNFFGARLKSMIWNTMVRDHHLKKEYWPRSYTFSPFSITKKIYRAHNRAPKKDYFPPIRIVGLSLIGHGSHLEDNGSKQGQTPAQTHIETSREICVTATPKFGGKLSWLLKCASLFSPSNKNENSAAQNVSGEPSLVSQQANRET